MELADVGLFPTGPRKCGAGCRLSDRRSCGCPFSKEAEREMVASVLRRRGVPFSVFLVVFCCTENYFADLSGGRGRLPQRRKRGEIAGAQAYRLSSSQVAVGRLQAMGTAGLALRLGYFRANFWQRSEGGRCGRHGCRCASPVAVGVWMLDVSRCRCADDADFLPLDWVLNPRAPADQSVAALTREHTFAPYPGHEGVCGGGDASPLSGGRLPEFLDGVL